MAKYVNKTQPTEINVEDFIKQNAKPQFVDDCLKLSKWMEKATGSKAVVWTNIIGYGKYHYITKACEADFFMTGFAPRASTIAIYILGKVEGNEDLLKKLGKVKMSGTCIHIKSLSDIDLNVLEIMVKKGLEYMKANYKILE